jgi:predicted deacetylase
MSCLDKKICIITIHDVSAFQDHLSKVIQTMNQIEDLDVKYNIAIIPNYIKRYPITKDNFTNIIDKYIIKDRPNIALHGLYHEYRQSIEGLSHLLQKKLKKKSPNVFRY